MDKKKLLEIMREQLERDRIVLIGAAQATYEAATNEESQPENQYDTRSLEAGYLAGAQSKRVGEIEEVLAETKFIVLKDFSAQDPIAQTAVVEIESDGKKTYVFLMPKGGGLHLALDGRSVQVITGSSPLGEALLGLKKGGIAVVETGRQEKEYEVLEVW